MYLPAKRKKIKIILSQLPYRFYNLEFTKRRSNVPLAAGFLKAMAWKEGLLKETDIEILDPLTADISSDSMLIKTLVNKKPDIIGFSLYLWNITRTLYIIKEIRRFLPKIIIVVGGPEVTEEFNYVSPQEADFSIIGEGENSFVQLIKHFLGDNPPLGSISNLVFKNEGEIIHNPNFETIADINDIPSPFLSGSLDPRLYNRYWLETMKWCPYRCKYCLYYYRSKIRNPFYSLDRIEEEFNYAKKLGIRSIDLHDSAFNLNPKFREICKIIQKINKDKSLKISLFLEAEVLKPEDVELLSSINIAWAEIGLQSANHKTLKNIERYVGLGEWLNGINLLRGKNINIMIDVMIGLPGEDLNSIKRTINFLKKNRLDCCSIPAILSVGPATNIRKESKKLGILRFQSEAPYYILETKKMNFSDIGKACNLITSHLTEKLPRDNMFSPYYDGLALLHDYSWAKYPYYSEGPVNTETENGCPQGIPITKIIIEIDSQSKDIGYFKGLASRLQDKIANNLTVWWRTDDFSYAQLDLIVEFLKCLSEQNPYNIWNIVLEGFPPLPAKQESIIKESISYLPNNLDFREIHMERKLGKREFFRVSTKLYYILPPVDNTPEKSISPRVEENIKVFRKLDITLGKNLLESVENICLAKDEGVFVNFDKKVGPEKISEVLRLMSARKDKHHPLRFKNIVFQKLWHKFFDHDSIDSRLDDDLILNIDAARKERLSYLSHKKIMLDVMEFTLSLRGRAGKDKIRDVHI